MKKMSQSLQAVPQSKPTESLEDYVKGLEAAGGNLHKFFERRSAHDDGEVLLFHIENMLELPNNAEYKKRWQYALKMSARVRMNLLRCKAFEMLENYSNKSSTSSAPDISFCKAMLIGILVEESEVVKARFRPKDSTQSPVSESTEMEALEKEFDESDTDMLRTS